jgi:integrase
MSARRLSGHQGIETRHLKGCASHADRRCNCNPSYRGFVWDKHRGKPVRGPWRKTLADAKGWRTDALSALRSGHWRSASTQTIEKAAAALIEGMRTGAIRTRSGHRFKPSAIRSYDRSLALHVLPNFGRVQLSNLTRGELQLFVDRCSLERSGSTVRNALTPLRVIYRRALLRGQVAINPTSGLELPALEDGRDRVAEPREAAALIAALSGCERAIWATAFYSGLRLGELRALRTTEMDLEAGLIRVTASWDQKAGRVEPKSRAARRTVPITEPLRAELAAWGRLRDWDDGLVFGRSAEQPCATSTAYNRADRAWKEAKLKRITLHECRHTYASYMIAAGVNAKALCSLMGHSSITETFDRYGHLFPGDEAQAGALLTAFLDN